MLKEITLHCERGWGNEHGERENEKWKQKRELEMKLFLGFIFIFPVTNLVARSPLTSQLYMNIDFKRGDYNIFLRIYYLSRISFLADCFILHTYMTWDTKKNHKNALVRWVNGYKPKFFLHRQVWLFRNPIPLGNNKNAVRRCEAPSTQDRTFFKPNICFPDSCGQSLKLIWKALLKRCGFGERINWLCADGRADSCTHMRLQKISRFVWAGPEWNTQLFLSQVADKTRRCKMETKQQWTKNCQEVQK